jgi:ParB family chromosome partitioning protein
MSAPPRRAVLGRGLSALIPGGAADAPPQAGAQSGPQTLPIEQLRPSDKQPRTEFDDQAIADLAASIQENGLIQPIVVRQVGPDTYAIIAGERRWRASNRAGLREVPVVIRDVTESHAYQLALIENVQRQDLRPLEEAEAYQHLMEAARLTQEEVAKRVGKDRATVSNALRLLRVGVGLRARLAAGQLTAGHVRALLVLDDEADQDAIAAQAEAQGWSVRETERQARQRRESRARGELPETDIAQGQNDEGLRPQPPRSPAKPEHTPTTENEGFRRASDTLETQLRAALGAPVNIVQRAGSGRIEVRFHSLGELERLVDLLTRLEGL